MKTLLAIAVGFVAPIAFAQKSGDNAAFLAAFEELRKFRASVEALGVANYGYLATSERYNANWPHKEAK